MEKKLPKSIRKYIRKEKARIGREVLDLEERGRQVQELYKNISDKLSKRSAKENIVKIRDKTPHLNKNKITSPKLVSTKHDNKRNLQFSHKNGKGV